MYVGLISFYSENPTKILSRRPLLNWQPEVATAGPAGLSDEDFAYVWPYTQAPTYTQIKTRETIEKI